MRSKRNICLLLMAVVAVLATHRPGSAQQPVSNDQALLDSATPRPDLYAPDADAKKEIEAAKLRAGNENKRVLLVFGANWCYDCHVLDRALHEGEAGKLMAENYVLVHVDIGEGEKNPELLKTYKIPLEKGVPAVAILASDGRLLYSSGQGEFEAARRMMKRDLVKFLTRWKPAGE